MQRYRMSVTASRRGRGGGCWIQGSRLRLHEIQGDMPKIDSHCRYINVSRKVKSGTTLAGWGLNVDRSTSNGGERSEARVRNRNRSIGRPPCFNRFLLNIIIHAGCHCSQMLSECCDAKWAGTSEGGQEEIQILLNCAQNSFRQCNLCMSQQATSTASSINNRLFFIQPHQLVFGNV